MSIVATFVSVSWNTTLNWERDLFLQLRKTTQSLWIVICNIETSDGKLAFFSPYKIL